MKINAFFGLDTGLSVLDDLRATDASGINTAYIMLLNLGGALLH